MKHLLSDEKSQTKCWRLLTATVVVRIEKSKLTYCLYLQIVLLLLLPLR